MVVQKKHILIKKGMHVEDVWMVACRVSQKRRIFTQKRRIFTPKRPIFTQNTKHGHSKETCCIHSEGDAFRGGFDGGVPRVSKKTYNRSKETNICSKKVNTDAF